MAEDQRWMVNTLEVIVNHYKMLEEEMIHEARIISEVRQEYEAILRNHILKNAVKVEGG